MDHKKIYELANLLRQNGDKILSSEFTLTLSGSLLRDLNESFTQFVEDIGIGIVPGLGTSQQNSQAFQVVKPINAKSNVFSDLQLLHDFVQKTTLLKLTYFASEQYYKGRVEIYKFRALRRLEVHKINICQVVGIQALRSQLQHLICVKSLNSVDDIITRCGGDNSNGFVWNELQSADFSYNNLRSVDTALEFAQHLQHLNLRHNKLISVTAIKWLPHLKTLDLSFNCLTQVPMFHAETYKRLQSLNMSNNYVEELLDLRKLDALTNLDLSDNYLLEHTQLLPLSVLMTLSTLNLQGNPLACHPKHRLATAQYLHKNTSTVRFVLDFEPMSKAEKSLTGSQQLRYHSSIGIRVSSSGMPINRSHDSINTMASSVGSQRSIYNPSVKDNNSSSDTEQAPSVLSTGNKRAKKLRKVDIEDAAIETATTEIPTDTSNNAEQENTEGSHLETKKQIETLRLKYGNEWLQSGNTELMLGLDTPQPSEQQRHEARQQLNEFLGDLSASQPTEELTEPPNMSSTPTNNTKSDSSFSSTVVPIKLDDAKTETDVTQRTIYESCDNSIDTQYESMENTLQTKKQDEEVDQPVAEIDKHLAVLKLYSTFSDEDEQEESVSDEEPDEKLYCVCLADKASESLFLTISSNYVREKDPLSNCTTTKWSIKSLESCERIKSNVLRIEFDTKPLERIYCIENALCQEIEKKLRDILSERDFSEMNITIYSCINCGIQFTRERRSMTHKTAELRCPGCKSVFVAEVNDGPGVVDKPKASKLSPALIVEEAPVSTPLVLQPKEDNNSIGSANSLNESSSCSKITNSQCSFDSNQSVVGSSNTERDLEFRANESDVDIISNPSQSSIEVLDPNCVQSASRKTSEERRISQMPNLQTIEDDLNQSQSFIDREFGPLLAARTKATSKELSTTDETMPKAKTLAHVQLTESSSSGSVTDSICTSYEQQKIPQSAKSEAVNSHNMLIAESSGSSAPQLKHNNNNNEVNGHQKLTEDAGLSSVFGALFQSTNMLMSSSKKLIESESGSSEMQPYKFNYTDFNDIDHRLKLYFYQTKFKEVGEHFKWLVKGRIYNDQTQTLRDGLLVISTCKCYLMEAFAPPQDDVSKWLRQVISVTVNRLTRIQCLPWKLGLSFALRDWGSFTLLLQDMLRTDSMLLYLADNPLPSECEMIQEPSSVVRQRLCSLIPEPLKMCAVLSDCKCISDQDKRNLEVCTLLTSDTHLHIAGNESFNWLSPNGEHQPLVALSLTQQMSNLVEVERITDCEFKINFLDDTENQCELWHVQFETPANAECCLNTIGKSWEQLFGVPLSYSKT